MAKSKYVLKRKGGSRKKKHVRFNLTGRSRKVSRSRTLRRSSTLGLALKKSSRRTRARSKSVAKGKYRSMTRGKTRSRLGGFRGGYGPGGGPVGAPWDGGNNVPGDSIQGLPNANHYAYNKGGIGVGGVDPAISSRTINGSQQGGGLMDFVTKMMPQDLRTVGDMLQFNAANSNAMRNGEASTPANPLPTNQKIDSEAKIVFPETPKTLAGFTSEAASEVLKY